MAIIVNQISFNAIYLYWCNYDKIKSIFPHQNPLRNAQNKKKKKSSELIAFSFPTTIALVLLLLLIKIKKYFRNQSKWLNMYVLQSKLTIQLILTSHVS